MFSQKSVAHTEETIKLLLIFPTGRAIPNAFNDTNCHVINEFIAPDKNEYVSGNVCYICLPDKINIRMRQDVAGYRYMDSFFIARATCIQSLKAVRCTGLVSLPSSHWGLTQNHSDNCLSKGAVK